MRVLPTPFGVTSGKVRTIFLLGLFFFRSSFLPSYLCVPYYQVMGDISHSYRFSCCAWCPFPFANVSFAPCFRRPRSLVHIPSQVLSRCIFKFSSSIEVSLLVQRIHSNVNKPRGILRYKRWIGGWTEAKGPPFEFAILTTRMVVLPTTSMTDEGQTLNCPLRRSASALEPATTRCVP